MTLYLSLVLHIYQPPTQTAKILKKISNESYKPLIQLLSNEEKLKLTLNINGSLTELLDAYQEKDIIEGIKILTEKKQIELTGTSCYHAILPLIPAEEIKRQINLNEQTQKKILGETFKPKGFWLPEMAFDSRVINPIKNKGYNWTIISSVASPNGELPNNFIPYTESDFIVFFRNDLLSNLISFKNPSAKEFFEELTKNRDYRNENQYVIIAMDGETYGHHIKGLIENFLKPFYNKILTNDDIQFTTISQLLDIFHQMKRINPVSSSWSTSYDDLQKGVPFPLWDDPENEIHRLQHLIINHVVFLVDKAKNYFKNGNNNDNESKNRFLNSRNWLDKGLHSCQLWWASKKPWYSAEMILKGLNQLTLAASEAMKVIMKNSEDKIEKRRTEEIFNEIFEAQKQLYLTV